MRVHGKKKKYLYYHKPSKRYVIIYKHDDYIVSRTELEDILPIYEELLECQWSKECRTRVKEKYQRKRSVYSGIYKLGERYSLYVTRDDKRVYCGTYASIPDAMTMKKNILENGFENVTLPVQRRKPYRKPNQEMKYIQKQDKGKYSIRHKGVCYGTFSSLADAMEERDALIKCGWDYDELEAYEAGRN